MSSSSFLGAVNVGSSAISFFIAWNASSASVIQWKSFLFPYFLRVSRHDRALSAALERNLFKASSLPLRRCICFRLFGEGMFIIAFVFSGFAVIPSEVIIYPKNLPSSISKEHFWGFNFMFNFLSVNNVSSMSFIIARSGLLLMTMSST
ncbi:hypothetical protein Tco_1280500 [Tanacetum coccineum]